jgi:hypothetical protein
MIGFLSECSGLSDADVDMVLAVLVILSALLHTACISVLLTPHGRLLIPARWLHVDSPVRGRCRMVCQI